MGGIWEIQIGTVKSVLDGLLTTPENTLSMSSLRTFFYEAMTIVNSRSLTVENHSDVGDLVPLSPNQLLTMKTGNVLPHPGDYLKEDAFARIRWRQVKYMSEQAWKRWRTECVQTLHTRQKCMPNQCNLKEGDVVIIKDDHTPSDYWSLARIENAIKAPERTHLGG